MEYTTIGAINKYRSESINPALYPDRVFEVYSVPIFETGHPEFLRGDEIGSTKQVVQKDDVLICKINPRINRVWTVANESDKQNIASSEWIVVRNQEYNPEFLAWYFRSSKFKALMVSEVAGIGGSLTRAQPKRVAGYPVPLLQRSQQDAVVQHLNSVTRIIEARQCQLRALDTLIKARFVEMFGEPSVNDRSYRQRQLGELVVNIIPGWSANGESRRMQGAEKAVLKVSAVTQGVFKPEEHKALPMGTEIKKYVYPHKGDLLFSRANTRELVGATAIIDQDYPDLILPDKLWRVLFTDEINVYYAKYVLSTETIRREFSAQSTGTSGSMFNVSAEKFSAIMIPVPPIQEQELFAAFVSQVDKSKVVIQKALDKAQLLFDSLMQKYFG